MGVLNLTPDSFSDGGRYTDPGAALKRARTIALEGARIIDIGGESTRPGSIGISLDEELRRVLPVLEQLTELEVSVPISVDTSKAGVASRAIELGAVMINDVTAFRADPALVEVVAESGASVCLMHMLGEPRTMQENPRYHDVVSEVARFLESRLEFAVDSGIEEERICLDPGIGFGKTAEHNIELLSRLGELCVLGRPILVGVSRKRFLARILGDPEGTRGPLAAGVTLAVLAYERGASIIRAHDVREHVEALAAARALGAVGLTEAH